MEQFAAILIRSTFSFLVLSLILIASIQAEDVEGEAVAAGDVRPHLEYLASPDRRGRDTWGKQESRDYILARFQEYGLQPLFPEDSWWQWLPNRDPDDGSDNYEGQNLGGFVQGTDPQLRQEWIVVNAHYDHLGVIRGRIYPGADDNASGVSMLLEVAERIAKSPLRRSVAFVSFDREEELLWGSRWFVAHSPIPLDQIKLCVTADMIGRSLGGLQSQTVFIMGAEHSHAVRHAIDHVPLPDKLELAPLGTDYVGPRSDYAPFRDERIPFLFYSTGETPDYHTPRDTLDKIDFDKTARISTHILRTIQTLGDSEEDIHWRPAEYHNLEEAQAVHRVVSTLLNADDGGRYALSNSQRFFVSQIFAKTKYMLSVERVTDEERSWLKRATQILMFTTF
ncbi:MAG: M28 family peptidase [Planctomycetaceae bacterium]|nr:M28 family peptidase [Planctomycetaceae bacterium]